MHFVYFNIHSILMHFIEKNILIFIIRDIFFMVSVNKLSHLVLLYKFYTSWLVSPVICYSHCHVMVMEV